ncbi:hypothetical protein PInf_009569 [Phytophthora infestans]|nr:hypothetical protein PInf_009569 [Phytophthora infestans]
MAKGHPTVPATRAKSDGARNESSSADVTALFKPIPKRKADWPALAQEQYPIGVFKKEKLVNTASATKEKRRKQIDANRTGLGALRQLAEEKSGLVQMSMASASSTEQAVLGTCIEEDQQHTPDIKDEVVPATPDSQEDFTMGASRTGTADGDADSPIQVRQWLHSFNGHEVDVKANGHCAFLALYASTKNHPPGTLTNSPSTVKHATQMKATTYACMMANLRHDVALGLVDPIAGSPPHTSVAAATAGLFAHYAQARDRTVDNWQPEEYWAGTNELRAMAQFLREPLLVLDANSSNDAHIQRYLYKDFRLDGGSDHESGYAEALTDREAADYLRTCWSLHVMPTFLVLRRQDRHFHGVGHGDLWAKWQAEGDPEYAATLPEAYAWKGDLDVMTEAEAMTDITRLNMLEDTPRVNTLIIKRVNNRDRLDIVHARRGLPTLDNTVLVYDLAVLLQTEASLLHAAYGANEYAADVSQRTEEKAASDLTPMRYTRSSTGAAVAIAYDRLLQAPEVSQLDRSDLPLLELM